MTTLPLKGGVDELYTQPANLLRRAHQISASLFHDELGKQITPVQYMILHVLADNPGIDQVTLAGLVAIDTSTAASVAIRLEEKGLLKRNIYPANRRQRRLFLTDEGAALQRTSAAGIARMHRRLFEGFSQQETRSFVALLQKLVDINNSLSRAPLARGKAADDV
ncbi:MarR family transcriptional regulator [Paenalcaligenes niemegkensis]|uniref:MarR family winged helix-turn-helix transcriptional regulator n=1 Tax=Paenalcaligenes niemegkensis TaxID=2895469 RepID=UPI001EE81DFA|nr:MarR family transcriptional regulator [Paenalcaligenes niemegkensis]MCQ9616173.1 MarR family transcriptional regulator [Paenalcaligenes niemegkensis]